MNFYSLSVVNYFRFIVIAVEKADAEEQLAEALPALERARKALENLNKEHVTEIRQFAQPPQAVQYVCACVAYLKGYKQADWKTCRGMMSETNFLQSLQNLDVDNIKDKEVRCCCCCCFSTICVVNRNNHIFTPFNEISKLCFQRLFGIPSLIFQDSIYPHDILLKEQVVI